MTTTNIEVDATSTAVVHVSVLPGCCDSPSGTAAGTVFSAVVDLSAGAPVLVTHFLNTFDVVVQCWAGGHVVGVDIAVVDGDSVELQGGPSPDLSVVRVVVFGRLMI
jgi:hypothetical protein